MTSRACRAIAAFTLFLGAVSLLPGGARADAAARSESEPVAVGITGVSPQVPDFTDTKKPMTFSGVLRNTGSTTLRNLHLEIQRSNVNTRSEMGSANGHGNPIDLSRAAAKLPETLAPNATASWTVSPKEYELFGFLTPTAGVYAIDIDVVDADDNFVGGQRTYVVWTPARMRNAKPSRIALMWPVVGQPGLTGQKKPDNSALPILQDQSPEQQFAADGRLTRILNDASGLTVNWLLDPDVLYTAKQLSGSYFYPDPQNPGKLLGSPGGNAAAWYTLATGILSSSQAQNCFNLLYGDPDLNTLSRTAAGQQVLKAATEVHDLVTAGGCRQSGPSIAWPSDGQADATTLNAIAGTKAQNLVTLIGSNEVSLWPSAHASLPNSPNTVVYDNYLSSVFAGPAQTPQPSLSNEGVLAGQLWLAQTALAEKDNTDRVLVVTPPRGFDPPRELLTAIKTATSLPASQQWFGLDSLNQVLQAPPTPEHTSALTKITTPNLPAATVDKASDSQKLDHALSAILPPGHSFDSAVPFRPVATWWRSHGGGQAYSKTVYDTVVADHGLVSFATQSPPLTMSGKSGTVPVTIRNQTNARIQVYLGARSSQTVQLKVEFNQGVHPVDPGQVATIRIPVQGEGNGYQVRLTAKLYTCAEVSEDCAYYPSDLLTPVNIGGGETRVTVKVSRIGIIALSLMIGSGMLLVLLIGLRVYRAKRAHHAPAQDTMAS